MASPSTPTHGKQGAVYRLRPNGFSGTGLNDITWGTGFDDQDGSAYFEVVIDATGTPDTFKFRKSGGAWTTGLNVATSTTYLSGDSAWVGSTAYSLADLARPVTHNGYWYKCTTAGTSDVSEPTWPTTLGATVADGTAVWTCQGKYQTITFAATTGHTLNDQWVSGNLVSEACTESGATAQITATANQILNPNSSVTFTDSGGATLERVDYATGTAYFNGNVTTVTAAGDNGYVPATALEKSGYIYDWSHNASLKMADSTPMGNDWDTALPGTAGCTGSATSAFIGTASFIDALTESASGTEQYSLLQLFNYDPDQDQTGDHFNAWVCFNSIGVSPAIGDIVKENISWTVDGYPSFVANV